VYKRHLRRPEEFNFRGRSLEVAPAMFPFRNADEILPGLWLGNALASRDETFLTEKKIQAVFNCTKNLPFTGRPVRKYRVAVDDNLQEEEIRNLSLWSFEIVYKIIHEYNQGPILVHCAAGMQRSAACVAMTLIAKKGLKTEDAIREVQLKRPIAFTPFVNFERAIREFEVSYDKEVRPRLQQNNH
jgi:dual specificity phosphatase 12